MTTINSCKGCITIDRCAHAEKYKYVCPCTMCIVKVMCGKACNEYLVFTEHVILKTYRDDTGEEFTVPIVTPKRRE